MRGREGKKIPYLVPWAKQGREGGPHAGTLANKDVVLEAENPVFPVKKLLLVAEKKTVVKFIFAHVFSSEL